MTSNIDAPQFRARSGEVSGFHVMYVPDFSADRDINVGRLHTELAIPRPAVGPAPEHRFDQTWELSPPAVYRDKLRQGVLFNYRRILTGMVEELERYPSAEWAIGVQDDARPLQGWHHELRGALENAPAPVVSLCHFADHGKKLYERGFAYATHTHAVWGQAVAYHRSIVPQLLAVANDAYEFDAELFRKWDDGLAAVMNLLHGGQSCFTTLAIFGHLEGKSTMGHLTNRGPSATIENKPPLDWSTAPSTKFPSGKVKSLILERTEQLRQFRANREVQS